MKFNQLANLAALILLVSFGFVIGPDLWPIVVGAFQSAAPPSPVKPAEIFWPELGAICPDRMPAFHPETQ
jgi:hypothetical protein